MPEVCAFRRATPFIPRGEFSKDRTHPRRGKDLARLFANLGVTPAKAGVQRAQRKKMDTGFRRYDARAVEAGEGQHWIAGTSPAMTKERNADPSKVTGSNCSSPPPWGEGGSRGVGPPREGEVGGLEGEVGEAG